MDEPALFGDAAKPEMCPFTVIVDNQEKMPWHFTGIEGDKGRPLIVNLITDRHLPTGDYSIPGFESRLTIERKSVADFYGSIGADRDRFEREMERMAAMEFGAVVIEGDWRELLIDRPTNIQVPAKVASRTIASWSMRYGVHFFPCMSRRHAELFTFALLAMAWRQEERKKKEAAKPAADGLDFSNLGLTEEPPF